MKRNVLAFYVDGRNDMADGGPGVDVDAGAISKAIVDGKTPHEVIRAACTAALSKASNFASPERKKWIRANKEEISEVEASESEAWDAFCAGRVDELCLTIEYAAVENLSTALGLDEDEETAADDDDEDGDDDEEDDDDEEEK